MPLEGVYLPSASDWARQQAELIEGSGGAKGITLQGQPVVLLMTVGARSRRLRWTPLMRVEHEGSYAVVASMGGAEHNPDWFFNLVANPKVELQDGPVRGDYIARQVSGDEKAIWWGRALEVWPAYADYQKRTTREIPVFVLEPG